MEGSILRVLLRRRLVLGIKIRAESSFGPSVGLRHRDVI